MLNRIRQALGLKTRISQAHAQEAMRLLRHLEDEFAVLSRHGSERSFRRACLIDETQALLYLAGVGTIGCEHLGLNNDGTPIKKRAPEPGFLTSMRPAPPMPPVPPPKPPLVVHTFRPKPRRTPVPAPPPFNPLYGNPAHPWRPPHQPPPAPRPEPVRQSAFGPGTLAAGSDDGASWGAVADQLVDDMRRNTAGGDRFVTGEGGDFSGAGASASWDPPADPPAADSGNYGGSD